jgi:hypothetical protein
MFGARQGNTLLGAEAAPTEPTSGSAMAMNADQFRKEAQEARQMADNATSPQDKEFWLHIAEEWLKLAQEAEKPKGSRWW